VRQKQTPVYLPDVLLAQVVWGHRSHWPKNWRQRVGNWLLKFIPWQARDPATRKKAIEGGRNCHPNCPLYGRPGVPHRHFVVKVGPSWKQIYSQQYEMDLDASFLGVLELFGSEENDEWVYDFSRAHGENAEVVQDHQEQIDKYKKSGRI